MENIFTRQWPGELRYCDRIGSFTVQIPLGTWLGWGSEPRYQASRWPSVRNFTHAVISIGWVSLSLRYWPKVDRGADKYQIRNTNLQRKPYFQYKRDNQNIPGNTTLLCYCNSLKGRKMLALDYILSKYKTTRKWRQNNHTSYVLKCIFVSIIYYHF